MSQNLRFFDPTPNLRFVRRDGKMILQQYFKERFNEGYGIHNVWRDVPIEEETESTVDPTSPESPPPHSASAGR